MTALGGGGIKQKRKGTHGRGQQCGDCRWDWVEVEEGIMVINGNGKKVKNNH